MATSEVKTFTIEGAQIIFRNFEGRENQYNTLGQRNFCVVLDQETADQMTKDGWNINYLKVREEGDEATPYIQVAVNFKNRPPRIVMMTSRARTHLDEETVSTLDWADIENVDLICRGYDWVVGAKSGTKAYLKSLFVTIAEDELEKKYAINDPVT